MSQKKSGIWFDINEVVQDVNDAQKAKSEMDFLRSLQRSNIERDLNGKFTNFSSNNLSEKRNQINELIQQIENEKVPEVKY